MQMPSAICCGESRRQASELRLLLRVISRSANQLCAHLKLLPSNHAPQCRPAPGGCPTAPLAAPSRCRDLHRRRHRLLGDCGPVVWGPPALQLPGLLAGGRARGRHAGGRRAGGRAGVQKESFAMQPRCSTVYLAIYLAAAKRRPLPSAPPRPPRSSTTPLATLPPTLWR